MEEAIRRGDMQMASIIKILCLFQPAVIGWLVAVSLCCVSVVLPSLLSDLSVCALYF
jgi:hypothetical protein